MLEQCSRVSALFFILEVPCYLWWHQQNFSICMQFQIPALFPRLRLLLTYSVLFDFQTVRTRNFLENRPSQKIDHEIQDLQVQPLITMKCKFLQ